LRAFILRSIHPSLNISVTINIVININNNVNHQHQRKQQQHNASHVSSLHRTPILRLWHLHHHRDGFPNITRILRTIERKHNKEGNGAASHTSRESLSRDAEASPHLTFSPPRFHVGMRSLSEVVAQAAVGGMPCKHEPGRPESCQNNEKRVCVN